MSKKKIERIKVASDGGVLIRRRNSTTKIATRLNKREAIELADEIYNKLANDYK